MNTVLSASTKLKANIATMRSWEVTVLSSVTLRRGEPLSIWRASTVSRQNPNPVRAIPTRVMRASATTSFLRDASRTDALAMVSTALMARPRAVP